MEFDAFFFVKKQKLALSISLRMIQRLQSHFCNPGEEMQWKKTLNILGSLVNIHFSFLGFILQNWAFV